MPNMKGIEQKILEKIEDTAKYQEVGAKVGQLIQRYDKEVRKNHFSMLNKASLTEVAQRVAGKQLGLAPMKTSLFKVAEPAEIQFKELQQAKMKTMKVEKGIPSHGLQASDVKEIVQAVLKKFQPQRKCGK